LDAEIILDTIQESFSKAMNVSDDFPRLYDDAEKGLLFLEQFVWLHNYVLKESENEEDTNEPD
jgi:hypothetical protein